MAGLPAKTVREYVAAAQHLSLMDALFVAARCKVSTRKAEEVIKTLADGGYIEFDHRGRELLNSYRPAWKNRDIGKWTITS